MVRESHFVKQAFTLQYHTKSSVRMAMRKQSTRDRAAGWKRVEIREWVEEKGKVTLCFLSFLSATVNPSRLFRFARLFHINAKDSRAFYVITTTPSLPSSLPSLSPSLPLPLSPSVLYSLSFAFIGDSLPLSEFVQIFKLLFWPETETI